MNISELHAKAACLERRLQETRELLAEENHDLEAITRELAHTRAYAFSAATLPVEELVDGCADSVSRYGFCVIDNVIPTSQVETIRDEVMAAQSTIARNKKALSDFLGPDGLNEQELLRNSTAENEVELRPVRRVGHPPKLPNDIVWMPQHG